MSEPTFTEEDLRIIHSALLTQVVHFNALITQARNLFDAKTVNTMEASASLARGLANRIINRFREPRPAADIGGQEREGGLW